MIDARYTHMTCSAADAMAYAIGTTYSITWLTPGGRTLKIRMCSWEYTSIVCLTTGRYIGRIYSPFVKWNGTDKVPARADMPCIHTVPVEHPTEGDALAYIARMWDAYQECEQAR